MIQPVSSVPADAYYAFRNFYPYRRDPPAEANPVDKKSTITDVVELSAEAQAFLTASKQNNNQLIS
jgi:hypothetical protein